MSSNNKYNWTDIFRNREKNRRHFISMGMMALVGLLFGRKSSAEIPQSSAVYTGKMVKMLTPDGKLVEVPEEVMQHALPGKRITNGEMKSWMNGEPTYAETNKSNNHV